MSTDPETSPSLHPPDVPPRAAADVERELKGDLPCVRCRYNLRGISVRGNCPECGTPIRVTILARVDPYAPVLRPITLPRATAAGVLIWCGGAAAAALITWMLRIEDIVRHSAPSEIAQHLPPTHSLASASVFAILCSCVGALALVRPHAGLPARNRALAVVGVLAIAAVALVHSCVQIDFDESHTRPYAALEVPLMERTLWRLAQGALIAIALAALRPNARLLAARSLLLRLGKVDRQTMLAMLGSLLIAGVGDGLHLLARPMGEGTTAQVMGMIGTLLIAVGSMLFTIGLFGTLVDSIRVASAVARPPLAIGTLLDKDRPT